MTDRILPLRGAHNPTSRGDGTNPGSFSNRAGIGGPLSFSSPDTAGMPPPSDKTAWDFLPDGWTIEPAPSHAEGCLGHSLSAFRGQPIRAIPPRDSGLGARRFLPITQLEHARLGIVTSQMRRV